jgi:ubiquinone/menaquinone biosynthesis C-methylase UbiE
MTTSYDTKTLSKQRYTRFAQDYVTSKTHARGVELNRLVEIGRPQPWWTALDIATGGGHTALKFAPYVDRVIATDITPRMLETAQAFVSSKGVDNVAFEAVDAEALPFQDGTFDLVTCRIAPHHFPNCHRFLSESSRVLKADGLLLVQDHALPEDDDAARYVDSFERLRDPSHNRAYSETEWLAMFGASGLMVEHREQVIKRHRFIPWAKRQRCTPDTLERLESMVDQAPEAVIEWMQPHRFGTPEASFVNRHILIAGRKA